MKELISIIMPFKNEEVFLEQTLKSIINQSYQNWELIAVDDFSTDDSFNVLFSYAQTDSRIKVLKNTTPGIIEALKTGKKLAKGKYITRMDADDLMNENKLENLQKALLSTTKNSVAIGKVNYFKSNGEEIGNGYFKYQNWINKLAENKNPFSEIYKECPIPSPSWMMRTDDFDKIGGFNSCTYPEDYDLAFRMYKAKLNIVSTTEVVHQWRDYETRTSRTHENYKDNRFLELKIDYFLSLDYNKDKTLVLQGAGKKGKFIAKKLLEKNVKFIWTCGVPSKIGHNIYGVILKDSKEEQAKAQIIVAIANIEEQDRIKAEENKNNEYFYFC